MCPRFENYLGRKSRGVRQTEDLEYARSEEKTRTDLFRSRPPVPNPLHPSKSVDLSSNTAESGDPILSGEGRKGMFAVGLLVYAAYSLGRGAEQKKVAGECTYEDRRMRSTAVDADRHRSANIDFETEYSISLSTSTEFPFAATPPPRHASAKYPAK